MIFVKRKRGLSLILVLSMIFSLLSGATTVRADEINPAFASEDKNILTLASPQTGTPYNMSGNYDVTVPHVIINQIYGGQKLDGSLDNTVPVSNSFVELYNPTDSDINLQGWTLNYACNGESATNGTQNGPWYTLQLTGTIKAHTSYLVRMMATQTTSQYQRLEIVSSSATAASGSAIATSGSAIATSGSAISASGAAIIADQDWNQFVANKGGVFLLLSSNETLVQNENPFIANAGKPVNHYVDMIGVGGNDAGTNDKIFAYESNFTGSQSKQKAIRRVGFQDTDYNATVDQALPEWGNHCDTQVIGYNALSTEQIEWARPRSQADGVWANYMGGTNAQAPMPMITVTPSTLVLTPGSDTSKLGFTWYSNDDATNNTSMVKVGPASTFPTGASTFTGTIGAASTGNKWHKVNVDNLTPGTAYAYSISNDGTNFSKSYLYNAPSAGDFSFASVGDPQLTTGKQDSSSNYHDQNGNIGTTKEGWQDTVAKIANTNISFIASVGDIIDSTTLKEEQYSNFFAPTELSRIPFSPAVGNHDINAGFTYHFNMPNLQSFDNPVASDKYINNARSTEIAQAEATGNYWYTYNNALFVVLNDSAYPTSKAQAVTYIQRFESTLSKAIAANPNYKWLFVQHHKSTESVADHLADFDIQYYVEAGFEKLMDTYKVNFVLAGHDHVYARSYPMKDGKIDQNNKGNDIVNPNGTVYLTLTTGSGLKYYTPFDPGVNNTNYPYLADGTVGTANLSAANKPIGNNVYLQAKIPEFTKVDVTDNKVTFNTYDINNVNTPIDSFTVTKTAAPKKITIFHTNDLHGSMVSSSSTIGLDKIAAYKNSVPGSLLIDGGDATQGNSLATLSKGADVITLMNMAGYDVMTAGNHEFDYGLDQLITNARKANFPILSANTVKNATPVLNGITYANGTLTNNGSWFIKEVDGVRVGFFGITTPETATKTNPNGIKGVTFGSDLAEITAKALAQINTLKAQGATVIVGLMHLGVDPSSTVTSEAIADSLGGSGLNLIIDGHSHSIVEEQRANGIYIAQSGSGAKNLGKVEITLNQNTVTKIVGTTITPTTATIAPVATITAKANEIIDQQKTLLRPIVGKTVTTLWGGTVNGISEARVYETNLGSLIADAMVADTRSNLVGSQYASLPIVALQNGGGVRAVIKAGDITKGDVLNVLPFGNSIAYKLVTPKVLYQALENGVGKITAQDAKTGKITGADGRFPQISGMRFEFDPTQTATTYDGSNNPITFGNRVTKIVLLKADGTDGVVLSKNDTTTNIVLASNDFEIAGGDGYTMLKGLTSVGEGGVLDQILADYVGKLTKSGNGLYAYPITTGRIKTVGAGYTPTAYTANITIKNMSGVAISNTSVNYMVDGLVKSGTTNANGVLSIAALADGPHTISFAGAEDVLINNYSGAGITNAVTVSTSPDKIAVNPGTSGTPSNNNTASDKNKAAEYTITFNNGITNATTVGKKLASLPTPTKDGHIFDGWYLDNATFASPVTTATVFTANTTVYAKWTAITVDSPANVKAKTASYNSIKLTWSAVTGATGYVVYRATSSTGEFMEVTTLTASKNTYTDVSLNTGSTYYYMVKAVKAVGVNIGYSSYSATVSAKPVLSKPKSLKVVKDISASATVTFTKVAGASEYEIYVATTKKDTFKLASSTELTSYTMTSLESGKTYYVKVRAYTMVGKTMVYSGFTSVRKVRM